MKFQIEPGIGVGPVKLGMSKDAVHAALGIPKSSRDGREGFLDGFFVDFDDAGFVEFIELAKSGDFTALFEGVSLHDLAADEAVQFVSRFDQFSNNNREHGYSFIFPKLQMSLWRGTIPEEDQDENDPDGRYFEAIGVAVSGYFDGNIPPLSPAPVPVLAVPGAAGAKANS